MAETAAILKFKLTNSVFDAVMQLVMYVSQRIFIFYKEVGCSRLRPRVPVPVPS